MPNVEHPTRPGSSLKDLIRASPWRPSTPQPNLQEQRHYLKKKRIRGMFVVSGRRDQSGPAISAFVQIYSSTEVDPKTGKGKLSKKANLVYHGKSKERNGRKSTTYKIKLEVEPEFGIPGAFLITNQQKHEFFLQSATIDVMDTSLIHFNCSSWVYPIKKTRSARLFFSNSSYLPSQTPIGLVELRKSDLTILKGDGTGEREDWDRIYDYDYYNDLGDPDKGQEHARPILGGSKQFPFPRRGRMGGPRTNTNSVMESRGDVFSLDVYVPPDERFSPEKLSRFAANFLQAASHYFLLETRSAFRGDSSNISSFKEIKDLFSVDKSEMVEGKVKNKLKKLALDYLKKEKIIPTSNGDSMEFPLPQILSGDEFVWMSDEEFGRQMLAGTNPTKIQRLQEFPPQGNNSVSKIRASHLEHNLDGLTLMQAMNKRKIFILDHHDYLMPFLSRINAQGVCACASRTLFFLTNDSTLKPITIELSLPGEYIGDEDISRVLLPASQGTEAALWYLAKAHVAANDSFYHQLISHWLHTHAIIEPFIIATRRQLSVMHPIHQLLNPHFKDTMHVNALARGMLLSSRGILEKILFSGKLSMELSSQLYKEWRFDEQALPDDLLKRGMALEDPNDPTGVKLLFQDYPYAVDGLDIWVALKTWVTDFCSVFYKDDASVRLDKELQAWWQEIRNVGHGDKRSEKWWYKMTTISNLIQAVTTIIWIASALHASASNGQHAYAAYPPNRPTLCRKFIPEEGTKEFAEFLIDPDGYYLKMLPGRHEMALGIVLTEILSYHTSEEVYLGQNVSGWTDNAEVKRKFEKFNKNLKTIEQKINERNKNPKLKNRQGNAKIPYKLLYPDTSNTESLGGISGQGIPNSVSI